MVLIRVRMYLFMYYTLETLLNHIFEYLRKPKVSNSSGSITYRISVYMICGLDSKLAKPLPTTNNSG
jgi:hypothetical protein